ncbi:MAG: molybdopterin molybdotransferase MoeA [Leptospiraceae bacterium]|nr:molybdopterin molybdotransferase MoeA [Leptospiraceae bacterium]MCP5495576.1 molybdopterin molybdotransferase MoeA [Leptospiraceae bacterium]
MISVEEAIEKILSTIHNQKIEKKFITQLNHYVLAEDVFADRDYPPFNRSAMDGYALSSKTFSKEKTYKVVTTLFAGEVYTSQIPEGSCIKIMTGAPVPDGLDAVVKVEDSEEIESGLVRFNIEFVSEWVNIACLGEDVKSEELVLKKGTLCTPQVVSILATFGKEEVFVFSKPRVAIFPTGNEIVSIEKTPTLAQIRDSNSYTINSFLNQLEIPILNHKILTDEEDDLKEQIEKSIDLDCIILTGGVSMGELDLLPKVMQELGVKEMIHKVKLKPGKPFWFGIARTGCKIFGLPGNPFSVQVTYKLFVEPWIRHFMGFREQQYFYFPIKHEKIKKHKMEEYFPVKLENENGISYLNEIKHNGSGDILAGLYSDGIAVQEEGRNTIHSRENVKFLFWI